MIKPGRTVKLSRILRKQPEDTLNLLGSDLAKQPKAKIQPSIRCNLAKKSRIRLDNKTAAAKFCSDQGL